MQDEIRAPGSVTAMGGSPGAPTSPRGDPGGPVAPESQRPLASAPPSPLAAFWYAFRENRGAVAGLVVVALIVFVAVFADLIAPYSPTEQFRDAVRAAPAWVEGGSSRFLLGTDGLGRDMLSRLLHGARISLFIGLAVMAVSFVIGVALGLACAALGSAVDVMVTRVMDLIMAVPSLVLAILVVAVLGPSLTNTIVAVTIVYLPRYVRLVRASALAELGKDYVTAARVAGVGPWRLMLRTVLPNCLAPLIVQAALGVSDAILEAAALGFLGLGAQPPTAEWGTMLADAREFIRSNPWQVTLPGLAILVTVVSINLAGDGLRDALDPKMRRS
jgi:dipeptide transport system permease protein